MKIQSFVLSTLVLPIAVARAGPEQKVLNPDKDNTLYEDNAGGTSNGQGERFFAGVTAIGEIRRGLLHFDVAGRLPAGATINSAILTLRMNMTIAGGETIALHRVQQDWGEGASDAFAQEGGGTAALPGDATWVHAFFNTTSWASNGGDFDATPSATRVVVDNGDYTWSSAQVTADVQSWLDDPATNYGWLVKHIDEVATSTAKRFASVQSGVHIRPELRIDFDAAAIGSTYCLTSPNSVGPGMRIAGAGDTSLALQCVFLSATGGPDNKSGIFFFGPNQLAGTAFGEGLRCVGGMTVRIQPPLVTGPANGSPAGTADQALDFAAFYAGSLVPGSTNFQFWYRDPMGGPSGFNTSDALEVPFAP